MKMAMAYYSSRVDDDGNDIEIHSSARSLTTASSYNISDRSCETRTSSVRYVNSAAYIEKTPSNSDVDGLSMSDMHYNILREMDDIVPPLDLHSEENYPTTRDYTYSYRKHCAAAKLVLKPDLAYETWLSAKRKIQSDEVARRKKIEDQKRKESEARKQLCETQFKKWLESKSRPNVRDKYKSHAEQDEKAQKVMKPNISEDEIKMRLEEWERTKRIEEDRRRIFKRQEEERRRELEEQRRTMAAEAWEKWLAEAAKKPKPVPLNRGIFTLRGTISDIYVNPNEWQSPVASDIPEE